MQACAAGQRMPTSNRNRVIVGLVAHQGLRVHLACGLITGIKRGCGQIHHGVAITRKALPDAVAVPTQDIGLTLAALLCQPDIQGIPCRKAGNGHHEVASRKTDQALDSPLVAALARAAVAVVNEGVRQEPGSNSLARLRVPPGRIFATRHRSLS